MSYFCTITGNTKLIGKVTATGDFDAKTVLAENIVATNSLSAPEGSLIAAHVTAFNSMSVPAASHAGHAVNLGQGDGRYGRLAAANAWSDTQDFQAAVSILNAAESNQPVALGQGDGRYGRLAAANVWTATHDFQAAITVLDAAAANQPITLGQGDSRFGRLASANTWSQTQSFNTGINIYSGSPSVFAKIDVDNGNVRYKTLGSGGIHFFQDSGGSPAALYIKAAESSNHAVNLAQANSLYGKLDLGNNWLGLQNFLSTISVPAAAAGGHAMNRDASDARYARLTEANTWSSAQTFNAAITVGAATSGGHAMNRSASDARYGRLIYPNTWTSAQIFNAAITVGDAINNGHALNLGTGDGRYGKLASYNDWSYINAFYSQIRLYASSASTFSQVRTDSSGYLIYQALNSEHHIRNMSGAWATIRYGTAAQQSDVRRKRNISLVDKAKARSDVRLLEPIAYCLDVKPDRERFGLSAQAVADIWPNVVDTDRSSGDLMIDYTGVLAHVISAVQDIDNRLEALEAA